MRHWQRRFQVASLLAPFVISTLPVQAATPLTVNGTTVSADVRSIAGTSYVRLSDIAKALGMVVVKTGAGYTLTKAGGAGQIEGVTQGKIGDTLFDGKWRFAVESMETADSYTIKTGAEPYDSSSLTNYNSATRVITPRTGNTLIVLHCRVANGQKTTETLWIAHGDTNTALADATGESHPPVLYDMDGAPIQSKSVAPGSKVSFPLIFSVPQGTEPKDLIFTLHNNHQSEKANDVRVSLKS